ncbi:MAG: SPFH domain-containing protein [Hymenobacter sp.]
MPTAIPRGFARWRGAAGAGARRCWCWARCRVWWCRLGWGRWACKRLFGKVQGRVLQPGLSVVNPLVDVTRFDTRTQNYTMSAVHTRRASRPAMTPSGCFRPMGWKSSSTSPCSTTWCPAQAPKILSTIGEDYQDKIVRAISRTRIRDNAVYYDAVALYSTRREEFQTRILAAIEKDFSSNGLQLDQLLIRNIQLPAIGESAASRARFRPSRTPRKCSLCCKRKSRKPSASASRPRALPTTSASSTPS